MTCSKNYEGVKKWREANPDLQRKRNLIYATKAQRWKTIKLSFIKLANLTHPCFFREFFT